MFDQKETSVKVMSDGIGGLIFIEGDEEIRKAIIEDGCHDVLGFPPVGNVEKGLYLLKMLKWHEPTDRGDGYEFVAEQLSCEKLQDPFETIKKQQYHIKTLEERGSIRFILDGEHKTERYSLEHILEFDKEAILENEEECDCSLNESVNCCEGDCVKFDNSEITGYELV
jgi:hypothetical protein